jgi:transposase InsO family protein
MRQMGIAGIAPGPNLSQSHPAHEIYPYLLRNVTINRPNQVWGIDLTYAILDWFSRFVISWELDQTLEIPFVLHTVDCALEKAQPDIWNSDQGSQFTSPQYTQRLLAAGVKISMESFPASRRAPLFGVSGTAAAGLWIISSLNEFGAPSSTKKSISKTTLLPEKLA